MSQAGILDIEHSNPQIPTRFDANTDFAIPIGNVLEILGGTGITTSGSGNTITIDLTGSGPGFDSINVDASTPPGTNPVVADGFGALTVTGGQVASNTIGANVIRTNSLSANSYTIQVQQAGQALAVNTSLNGVSHFNSSHFSVTNGFVSLAGMGLAIDSIAVDTGTSPITPNPTGLVTINGAVVAAGTNPIRTDGTGANTMAIEVQISQAIAAADATKIGLCNFDSSSFTVAATGFVTASGTGLLKTLTGDTGGAISPTANNINTLGSGSITIAGSGSTLTTQLTGLTNHAVLVGAGTTTITKLAVGTNGQVLIGATGADPAFATITSTGGTIAFTLGANTLNMEAATGGFLWSDVSGAFSPLKENGYFITGTATGTLPAAPANGDTIQFFVDHASQVLTIQATSGKIIRFGSTVSAAAGTAVSTAQGDSVELVYRSTNACWCAMDFNGIWNII